MKSMPLPPTVRVKLSSEAAGSISLTPVVVEDLAMRELVEHILGVIGKDEERILQTLARGTLVAGGSRFRWQGWEAEREALRAILATFPDAEPLRAFAATACVRVWLRDGRQALEVPREAGSRKGLFRRESFWDELMRVAAESAPRYAGYSYRDRCDRYVKELMREEAERIRVAAEQVTFSTLREKISGRGWTQMELHAERGKT